MVRNNLLMQFQADILDRAVVLPAIEETTSLGAAYAAGLAVGFFRDISELCAQWTTAKTWRPEMAAGQREEMYRKWKKAVSRSFDWVDD